MTQENECRRAFEEWWDEFLTRMKKQGVIPTPSEYAIAGLAYRAAWKARGEHDGK